LIAPLSHALTKLTAQVDRNPVMVGETMVLTLRADDNVNANSLDTSALLKQFVVGQTSISRTMQSINGQQKRLTTWTIGLIARTAGQYTIPTFNLNGITSQPITLKVINVSATKQSNSSTTSTSDVMLEAKISNTSVYVGQQLTYTVKLFIGVTLQQAQLQAPELANAEISQMGDDLDTTEIINGQRYRVFTRTYSIRPTESGTVTMQGSIFRGDIQIGQRGYFASGRSKPVTLLTDNLQLTIKPIPDNFPGQWLVSEVVDLQEQWPDVKAFKVGEPITRTLTLTATNVTKEQLPSMPTGAPATFQAYPDKPISQSMIQDGVMISQAILKIAMIPTQAGDFILPAIKIPWLNATTGQIEWATIKQQTITVTDTESTSPANAARDKTAATTLAASPLTTDDKKQQPLPNGSSNNTQNKLRYWQFACLALSLLSMVLLVLYIRLCRSGATRNTTVTLEPTNTIAQQHWSFLETALLKNQPQQVIRLMPLWLNSQFGIITEQLLTQAPALHQAYQQLMSNCYQQQPVKCNCNDVLTYCLALKKQGKILAASADKLYPSD